MVKVAVGAHHVNEHMDLVAEVHPVKLSLFDALTIAEAVANQTDWPKPTPGRGFKYVGPGVSHD